MTTLLAKVRADAAVRVLPARYSAHEMRDETQRIIHQATVRGGHVTEIAPLGDASGLQISVRESTVAPGPMIATDGSGMQLVIRPGVAPQLAYDRYHDTGAEPAGTPPRGVPALPGSPSRRAG